MEVAKIFAVYGEGAFRRMEREIAVRLAAREATVISTGGKMLLDRENVAVLGRSGKIYCLTATVETILARLSAAHSRKRPLLQTANPEKTVIDLVQQRRQGYSQFPTIETDALSPEEICSRLLMEFIG
jgi:shikimate kinase